MRYRLRTLLDHEITLNVGVRAPSGELWNIAAVSLSLIHRYNYDRTEMDALFAALIQRPAGSHKVVCKKFEIQFAA